MKKRKIRKIKKKVSKKISLSGTFTALVTAIVLATAIVILVTFVELYRDAMEQNAVTSSEQAVNQVRNTVTNYTEDMAELMSLIESYIHEDQRERNAFFQRLLEIRSDVVAITMYDMDGNLRGCWSNGYQLKEKIIKNLSYVSEFTEEEDVLQITKPHVESLFVNAYPWVVTLSDYMEDNEGKQIQIAIDIRFQNIASYVDDVGIGQHGYCYIADQSGNIIYHPQQQLIYSGLKEETEERLQEGSHTSSNVIYTVHSLENCNWRIVGVCYVDEMITSKVENMVSVLVIILAIAVVGTALLGGLFSKLFSKPVTQLAKAMGEFEGNTENFTFRPVSGTSEIISLSESFEHMATRIQKLMEQVRQEEISLRKTELKALQAQINPHFLYNTLDAIAWLCEEERNQDAVEMVNALAKLFRISISRGHELITLEKEMQHAESYLKIQKFRYKNQFTYHFDVDPECLPYLCNKITLQPIIENAIYHGLDRMVDEGTIRIGIHQQGDNIVLTVEDNGVGMSKEQCEEILHEEASDRTGIGIKNVNDRIKIYFGNEYGLSITSELDEGTCVTICMPKVTEYDYDEK